MFAPASKKQEMMIQSDADFLIIGGAAGSGKSFILNMLPLRYANDPNFTCVVFRRTTVQVTGQGGMWDTAKKIYAELPPYHRPRIQEGKLKMTFPSGATVKFHHMEHVKNKHDHQGLIL